MKFESMIQIVKNMSEYAFDLFMHHDLGRSKRIGFISEISKQDFQGVYDTFRVSCDPKFPKMLIEYIDENIDHPEVIFDFELDTSANCFSRPYTDKSYPRDTRLFHDIVGKIRSMLLEM